MIKWFKKQNHLRQIINVKMTVEDLESRLAGIHLDDDGHYYEQHFTIWRKVPAGLVDHLETEILTYKYAEDILRTQYVEEYNGDYDE